MRLNNSVVPLMYSGRKLADYLSERFSYLSSSQWISEILCEKISVNGITTCDYNLTLCGRENVAYDGRGIQEPDVDADYAILYEDEYIVAINKTGDLPVHPAGRYLYNTLTMLYEKVHGYKVYPVHRLDRETSGIIICAKSSEYAGSFSAALSDSVKEYTAVVHGCPEVDSFVVDMPIGKDIESLIRKKRKAFPLAKEKAVTRFSVAEAFGEYSLITCYPETGRLHQIRVHLLYAGFPIVGDKMYGIDESFFLEFIEHGMTTDLLNRIKLPRTALHASGLKITHPYTKKEMVIASPLPAMFNEFIERERVHG